MLEAFKVKYSKIKSIKSVGKQKTYDIEMEKEPHSFIANNFVSHNSHSVSYSFLGYQMAYLKCYYRKYFILGVLNNLDVSQKQDQDKMKKTLDECARQGFYIKPNNLNEISIDFTLDPDGNIIAGAKAIKGLGEKGLVDIVVGKPYKDLSDLLTRVKPHKNVLERLNEEKFIENTFGEVISNEDLIKMRDNINKKRKGATAKLKTDTMFD
jgi:DNA polymerase III alpha subunit